ncbi:MAG: helix-turn-helix transcriptional regulator [Variovorax sp.]|nr:helix-turn-helix transcriptional regulator [Variovorax sp.]
MRSNQDPVLLQAFAAEIKARRAISGISQEGLAFASGVNRTFVAKLELGQTSPSLTTIFRVAEGLEVQPDELIQSTMRRYKKELRVRAKTG